MSAPWASAVETHTAALFFAGDRVVKVKKPVRLDFLDLTTAGARRRACEAEVTLNRRLSPDVYLGVADVTLGGHFAEPAVVMRRLPDDRSLEARIRAGDDSLRAMTAAIAARLASFHGRAPTVGVQLPMTAWTPPPVLWQTEIDHARRPDAPLGRPADVDLIETQARTYAAGRTDLFRDRVDRGLVREGHGDLLAGDIYLLAEGIRILDCLEFDQRLRVCDVLHDAAFLAMDLERLGRGDLAALFLREYASSSGESHPATLAHYFIAHRALIRAKVAAIRARQLGHRRSRSIRELVNLCVSHLDAAQPRLILLGGLPGAGKSTLAAALAKRLPAVPFGSDRLRYELTGSATTDDFEAGTYAPPVSEAVYRELLLRAASALRAGEHVIVDASWRAAAHRTRARTTAADANAIVVELEVHVDDRVAAHRLAARPPQPGGSVATTKTREMMRTRFDSWPEAVLIDTGRPMGDAVRVAAAAAFATAPVAPGHARPERHEVSA